MLFKKYIKRRQKRKIANAKLIRKTLRMLNKTQKKIDGQIEKEQEMADGIIHNNREVFAKEVGATTQKMLITQSAEQRKEITELSKNFSDRVQRIKDDCDDKIKDAITTVNVTKDEQNKKLTRAKEILMDLEKRSDKLEEMNACMITDLNRYSIFMDTASRMCQIYETMFKAVNKLRKRILDFRRDIEKIEYFDVRRINKDGEIEEGK